MTSSGAWRGAGRERRTATETADNEVLLVEKRGGVLIATMSRPDKRNALNRALGTALRDAFDADPNLHRALLTGNGQAFSAGGDLKEIAETKVTVPGEDSLLMPGSRGRLDKPVIAAVKRLRAHGRVLAGPGLRPVHRRRHGDVRRHGGQARPRKGRAPSPRSASRAGRGPAIGDQHQRQHRHHGGDKAPALRTRLHRDGTFRWPDDAGAVVTRREIGGDESRESAEVSGSFGSGPMRSDPRTHEQGHCRYVDRFEERSGEWRIKTRY